MLNLLLTTLPSGPFPDMLTPVPLGRQPLLLLPPTNTVELKKNTNTSLRDLMLISDPNNVVPLPLLLPWAILQALLGRKITFSHEENRKLLLRSERRSVGSSGQESVIYRITIQSLCLQEQRRNTPSPRPPLSLLLAPPSTSELVSLKKPRDVFQSR